MMYEYFNKCVVIISIVISSIYKLCMNILDRSCDWRGARRRAIQSQGKVVYIQQGVERTWHRQCQNSKT